MKRYTLFFIVVLLLSCKGGEAPVPAADDAAVLVQSVRECSRLYTAECRVRKIVTHTDDVRVSGRVLGHDVAVPLPATERRVAIPITATCKAYIDMGELRPDDIRRDGRRIEVCVPQPHVVLTATAVDHAGIRQYASLLRPSFTDAELARYQQQGRQAIIADIPHLPILDEARRSAAQTLIPLITRLGYDEADITITFTEDKEGGLLKWKMENAE